MDDGRLYIELEVSQSLRLPPVRPNLDFGRANPGFRIF